MKKLITAACLLVLAATTNALDGRLIDDSGQPLVGVNVATSIETVGAITDSDGRFTLPDNEAITRIIFSSVGYQTRQVSVEDLSGDITLARQFYRGDDILVTADRAQIGISPVAFDNLSADEIDRDYTVGEFPLLLASTPNLHAFSDGGAPLGYSYLRIRGFDDKRIATYINGVPLNDPEDQATYFVDLPDFGATISDIQVQRGVGNSLYGDASFGGSVNVVTSLAARPRSARMTLGYGEYLYDGGGADIYKQAVEYASGLIDNRYALTGRFSKQKTGGYRHHSWYEGWAYALSVARLDRNMTTEQHLYGGPIRMHLSFWGASRDAIDQDRRYNPLTYKNETDNFNQPHYHLHNKWLINDRTTLSNTFYYIRGKGYYEQYKDSSLFENYNISPLQIATDPSTGEKYTHGDLVRQQWVEKNQYGWNPRLDIEHARGRHSFGGSIYYFESDHWGQVVWAEHINSSVDPRHVFYCYFGEKIQASLFATEQYELNNKFSIEATAQLRYQRYQFDQERIGAFVGHQYEIDWLFISPRLGFNYQFDEQMSVFANVAVSSRTPTDASIYDANDPDVLPSLEILEVRPPGASQSTSGDTTYVFGDPTADNEQVIDFELGGSYRTENWTAGVTLFWMDFANEIIPYGGINENTGVAVTVNADRSVHAGIEFSGAVQINEIFKIDGNLSYNYNRVKEFVANLDGYQVDFADQKVPLFPDYIGNLILDAKTEKTRTSLSVRVVGKQYMELLNDDDLAIDSYVTLALATELRTTLPLIETSGTFKLRVDNLFNNKYETSGYGGNYAYDSGSEIVVGSWAEYYVGPERSIYGELVIDLF
jgi:iron complex outermembrane receptor protein